MVNLFNQKKFRTFAAIFGTMMTIEDIKQPIRKEFDAFESRFEEVLQTDNVLLQNAISYILQKRGKQLRPMLVLLSAKLCNGITDKTIQIAVALELLHTASLIHDDVVDNSDMRRGIASVNARWNNKVAVLLGDFLLSKVIELIATLRNVKILNVVAGMGRSLSSGELLQLHTNQSMWISETQYFSVIRQKTAELFAACMQAGALSSGCTQKQESVLREFGEKMGICFQLKDDCLDYSDYEDIGKPTMGDIRDGKVTLPLIKSLERAPKDEAAHIRTISEDLQRMGDTDVREASLLEQEIKSFVLRYDGLHYMRTQMEAIRAQARGLMDNFADCKSKESLLEMLNYAINRIN